MADNAFSLANQPLLDRLRNCSDLPSPPNVAERIIQLGQDPAANLDDVVTAVKTDPALTAKLLQMANSALYARQRKIDNLRQALLLFGLNGTLTLALSFSLVSSLRAKSSQGLDYMLYWRRSLSVAAASQALGRQLQLGDREELFLAGLLQDVGMLALDKVLPDLYHVRGDQQEHHAELAAHERRELGVDHATVGAWLLHRWNLPDSLCYATAASHAAIELKVPEEHAPLTDCIKLASVVADVWLREDRDQAVEEAAELADKVLGMDRERLEGLMDSVKETLLETGEMFDVDLGDSDYMDRILSRAKEVLLMRNLVAIQQTQDLRRQADELSSRTRILENQVNHDTLTGVFSRQYLERLLAEEHGAARHHGWSLAVAFVDIDHFKRVNDRYGHPNGDRVLQQIAQGLMGSLRDSDAVGRFGGEEFVLVLPGTGLSGAKRVCERVLGACREGQFRLINDEPIHVTVSIGLAVHAEPAVFDHAEDLLRTADQCLYDAKSAGRDRLVVYEPVLI